MPIAAIAVYANTLAGGFVWDDRFLIVDNPRVQRWDRLGELLANDYVFVAETDLAYGYFRPLSSLSLAADFRLWGLDAAGFHLTNVLLHALSSLGVALIAKALGSGRGAAVSAGLLFALHPLHTESVAWIAGRTDLLALLFSLASFGCYLAARRAAAWRRGALAVAATALFALALAAKEIAAVVVLWIALHAYWQAAGEPTVRRLGRAAIAALPTLTVVAAYLILRLAVLDVPPPATPPEHSLGLAMLTAAPTVARYLGWLILPVDLSAYVQNPYVTRAFEARSVAAALALAVFVLAVARLGRSRPNATLFAAMLAVSFLPLLNFLRIAGPPDMGATMAERFAYLPSFPFLLLATLAGAAALERFTSERARPWVGGLAVAAVALPWAAVTVDRNRDWKDDVTLFRHETARTPEAPLLWTNLAQAEMRAGHPEASEQAIRRAEALSPDALWVLAVRAQWLTLAGRYPEALAIQTRIVAREERENALAENNLAFLYRVTGQGERALALLSPILHRLPSYPDPWLNLAELERGRGNRAAAIAAYATYLELRPRDLRAVEPYAALLVAAGRQGEAESVYRSAMRGDLLDARLWNNLAVLRLQGGDTEGALAAVERALALDPGYARARFNRARLLALRGEEAESRRLLAELAANSADPEIAAAAARELAAGNGPSAAGPPGTDSREDRRR